MPPKSSKVAKAGGASAAANRQATALAAAAAHFKANCIDSDDPTGSVWGALRPFLVAQYSHGILRVVPDAPDLPLFSVHDFPGPVHHKLPSTCSPLSSASAKGTQKRWPLIVALAAEGSQRRDFASIEEFKEKLTAETCGAFKYVDFQKYKCIVAGGVVEACLRASDPAAAPAADDPRASGDADVFFYGIKTWKEIVKTATAVGAAIVRGMRETPGVETVRLERRTGTVNVIAQDADGNALGRPVQLVLLGSKVSSASRILHSFDLDCAQFGWQGGDQVVATWKGVRAWVYQANVVDIEHIMMSHRGGRVLYGDLNCEGRLFKYFLRGYSVALPGITATALEAARAEAIAAPNRDGLHGLPLLLRLHHRPPRNLYHLVENLRFGERGYEERAFEGMVIGAGADAARQEAGEEGYYEDDDVGPMYIQKQGESEEDAVRRVIEPSPFLGGFDMSGGFDESIELPWMTNLSALAYQKSWASGKEDGITNGIRPPGEDECVIC